MCTRERVRRAPRKEIFQCSDIEVCTYLEDRSRRVGTYSCLINYLRLCICTYVCMCACGCVPGWIRVDKPVHEREIFVDGDMDGCLHDELW